jgi:lipoate-protein ligase A
VADPWYLVESGLGPADYNMALDEALLLTAPRWGRPVLRFYGWNQPAASFGYFQRYHDIAQWTQLRPLVRRPTGGGLVPHLADWTYSLAFPPTAPWYGLRAVASYRQLHEWIRAAFARLGLATELSSARITAGVGQCFVGAEKFDLLWKGKKIAGAAQRRTRSGLLIQGSVQPPPGIARTDWQQAMRETANSELGVYSISLQLDSDLSALVTELVGQKYSQAAYNERR